MSVKSERFVPEGRLQSSSEEIINSALHGIGVVLALAGGSVLVHEAWGSHDTLKLVCALAFTATMVILYGSSTIYHALENGPLKDHLQRLDRTAIALLIAGTCTPIALLMVRGWIGALLCVGEWLLATGATVLMMRDPQHYTQRSARFYHGMGWLTALGAVPLVRHTPTAILAALALGGLCYLVGIAFLVRDRIRYFHAIFHVFALLGTAFQFWAIRPYVG
ncbi:MAG: PAQR family membrane homeostasis protein TrhA [Acidiferrobacter sp.]